MSISISVLTTPTQFEPINAPLWFRINSASSSVTDFKYIFRPEYRTEPYSTTTYTTLGTYKVPPKPGSGDGLFSPHRTLKSFLNTNNSVIINPYFTTGFLATSATALIDYRMKYGFEYTPNVRFTDTISVSGNMGLTFSTSHDFLAGDLITLNKDNKNYNPQYDGTCSVVSVVNAYSIKTDKVFSTTLLSGESGYVTDLFRLTGTVSGFYTWNGTRQYDERTKDFTQYLIATQSGSGKFLTNCYNTTIDAKPVQLGDYETLSLCLNTAPLGPYYLYVNTFNSAGTLLNTYTCGTASIGNTYRRLEVGVGPMNLPSVDFNGVASYRVYIANASYVVSEYRWYKIDTQCSNYDKQRIAFLNRMGGWDYFSFTLDTKRTINITRTEYEKILNWNYNVGDRGKNLLAQKAEIKMTMNSNWITEKDATWLEELLTSPEVYLLNTTNSTKLPIIITDTTYEVKTALRNQVFNLVLNYKFAYDINLQNE
jgi:hypothetical protein